MIWSNESRDKLGKKFLITNEELQMNDFNDLSVQEVEFLLASVTHFMEDKTFPLEFLKIKEVLFKEVFKEKVKNIDKLFVLYSNTSCLPFILEGYGHSLVYTIEEYGQEAVEHYKSEGKSLMLKEVCKEDIQMFFIELYRIGVDYILFDMCSQGYKYLISREEILPSPHYSDIPQISRPIYNRDIMNLLALYYQALGTPSIDNNGPYINNLLDNLKIKLLTNILLIPVKLDREMEKVNSETGVGVITKGTNIQFPALIDKEDEAWIPIFTDWEEFKKAYTPNEWSGQIITYKDALEISKHGKIVLNPMSVTSLKMNEAQNSTLVKDLEQLDVIQELIASKKVNEHSKGIYLGNLREEDKDIVEKLKEVLKSIKEVKKAYIKIKVQDSILSYFLILDINGDKKEIFPKIAKSINPYIKGTFIDMCSYEEQGKHFIKEEKPFFKRVLFS